MTSVGVFGAIFDDEGRILCVKRNYGPKNWTNPGGKLEPGEDIYDALVREVQEETGYVVEPAGLIGVYAAPFRDDLLIFLRAEIVGRREWQPDGEISEIAFFAQDELPEMGSRARARIDDAFHDRRGVVRVFEPDHTDAGT